MENFTIHIFGYGETQINSKDLSIKVLTNTLATAQPIIDAIFAKKPEDNSSVITEFHAINIFGNKDIRWMNKGKNIGGFNVSDGEDLEPIINALISELQAVKDAEAVVTE
jgi:hypothetical protein